MTHSVYILESETLGLHYKGYTTNISRRLWEHNEGLSRYTRNKGPWKLVFLKEFETKKEALIYERMIKRANSECLKNIIAKN
jgi:putative endonuclease